MVKQLETGERDKWSFPVWTAVRPLTQHRNHKDWKLGTWDLIVGSTFPSWHDIITTELYFFIIIFLSSLTVNHFLMVFVPELHLKIQNWNEVEVINPLKEFLYYIIISAGGTWEEGWRPRPAEMIGRDYWWWGFIPYGHSAPVDEDLRLVNLFKAEGMIEGAQSDRDRPEGTKGNYWNRNILWKFSILSISSASAATGAPQGPVSPAKRGRCARRNDNRVKKSLLVGSLGSSRAATVSGSLLHSVPPKEMMKGIIYAPQAEPVLSP